MSTVDNNVPARPIWTRNEFAVPRKSGRGCSCHPHHLGSQVVLLSQSEKKQRSFDFKNLSGQKLGYNLKDLAMKGVAFFLWRVLFARQAEEKKNQTIAAPPAGDENLLNLNAVSRLLCAVGSRLH